MPSVLTLGSVYALDLFGSGSQTESEALVTFGGIGDFVKNPNLILDKILKNLQILRKINLQIQKTQNLKNLQQIAINHVNKITMRKAHTSIVKEHITIVNPDQTIRNV